MRWISSAGPKPFASSQTCYGGILFLLPENWAVIMLQVFSQRLLRTYLDENFSYFYIYKVFLNLTWILSNCCSTQTPEQLLLWYYFRWVSLKSIEVCVWSQLCKCVRGVRCFGGLWGRPGADGKQSSLLSSPPGFSILWMWHFRLLSAYRKGTNYQTTINFFSLLPSLLLHSPPYKISFLSSLWSFVHPEGLIPGSTALLL